MKLASVSEAAKIIRSGGVVAYPTESCYGLGCDPKNYAAVRRLLHIKRRPKDKGLILIADHQSRFRRLVDFYPDRFKQEIITSWPGPNTWLLPAISGVSRWLRGSHNSIAVRVTRHVQARQLCCHAGRAIVSTSANRSRKSACRTTNQVFKEFGSEVDCVMEGAIGPVSSRGSLPSVIRDGFTGEVIRG